MPVCPLLNLLYQLVFRMRNSRILVIIEMDLGLNRFENDSQHKGYLDGSLLYIAIERPLKYTTTNILLRKYSCQSGQWAAYGWASDIEPETLYFLISSVAVLLFFRPCFVKFKMSDAQPISCSPAANPKQTKSGMRTSANTASVICFDAFDEYL